MAYCDPWGNRVYYLRMRIFIVITTLLLSFLSLLGVIAIAKTEGIDPSQLKIPDAIYHPGILVTVLGILIVPIIIVFVVQKVIHRENLRMIGINNYFLKPFLIFFISGFVLKTLACGSAILISSSVNLSILPIDLSVFEILPYIAWFVLTLFLNSFNEELVYRAYAIGHLKKIRNIPNWLIVLFTAIIFSCLHFIIEPPDLRMFLYRFIFGIVAGVLYLKTENVWGITGFHTGWNLVALALDSHGDIRNGVFIRVLGIDPGLETIDNIIILALVSAFLMLRFTQQFQNTYKN